MIDNFDATIYKYALKRRAVDLVLPKGAVFLHAECQYNVPMVWFRVYPESDTEIRTFHLLATGGDFYPGGYEYLQTVMQKDFVWHLHELIKE